MTAKTVEDLFLVDDLREAGCETLADAFDEAQTHEEVQAVRASLQWFLDWVDAG